jgi:hypothetical protein
VIIVIIIITIIIIIFGAEKIGLSGLPLAKPKCGQNIISSKEMQKIHPLLIQQIEREEPYYSIEVIVTLQEDQKLSPLPDLDYRYPRESQINQNILKMREAAIFELAQRRKSSQAELIRKLQPFGLVVLEQYWIVNGFLAKIPACSVQTVAGQPEVTYIRPRFAGEPPPR